MTEQCGAGNRLPLFWNGKNPPPGPSKIQEQEDLRFTGITRKCTYTVAVESISNMFYQRIDPTTGKVMVDESLPQAQ